MWLVYNGVPWEVAINMDDIERTGIGIILSEFNGNKFDVNSMRFLKNEL